MLRTLTLSAAAALALLSGSAYAAGIPVQVAGRDPTAIRLDIADAARKVCTQSVRQDGPAHVRYGSMEECVSNTTSYALNILAGTPNDTLELASR